MDPVQTERAQGAHPNEGEFKMTATMPTRAYAIHFTEGNLYSTYEYLHRQGRFCHLVRDVDPEGNESIVPETFDTWSDGAPLTFNETCEQFASNLLFEVATNAQALFDESANEGDDPKKLFVKAEVSMEMAFKKMGWGVDMVSFIPHEPIT